MDSPGFLAGGGEMGARIRAHAWDSTALGPPQGWPQALKSAVSLMLSSKAQIALFWGADFVTLYNDAYRPVFGAKHPSALGVPARECWSELWPFLGPIFAEIVGTGEAFGAKARPFFLERHGFPEETYFDVSYDPVRDEAGRVQGVYCIVSETTGWVLGERRLRTLRELGVAMAEQDMARIAASAIEVLAGNSADIPYALLYLVHGGELTLAGCCGASALATSLLLDDAQQRPAVVAPSELVANLPSHARPDIAMSLPLQVGTTPLGRLIVGVSRNLTLEGHYQDFLELVAAKMGTALGDAQAFELERHRATMLADLDRAKTTFFSNVSHELRTPLTLIIGPVADALAHPDRTLSDERLEAVHRNADRLLKLVESLLNFSRMEAGRMEVSYEPVDLASLTAGLASSFHTAMTYAGVEYEVACAPLSRPVYVDRHMWETIVLNLVSNAFKFTLEGSVRVELAERDEHAELIVRDTGVGIPAASLPHVFDRFYRAKHARARTHEGTGIGLALVHELVHMHGGTITVSSIENEGSTFTVRMPFGTAGLTPAPGARRQDGAVHDRVSPYVQEALRWLPVQGSHEASAPSPSSPAHEPTTARILLADDNADMREYIRSTLAERWAVETAANGLEALEKARANRPDLLITDVMMPGLDGFQLLGAIRADGMLHDVPVMVLSARAGDQSRLDGLAALADDYVEKPFSARELLARVDAQLRRSWMRSVESAHNQRLVDIFRNAPVGIAILHGPDHVFEFANEPYLELVGHRSLLGRPLRRAFHELGGQGVYEVLDQVYASGSPYVAESMAVRIDRGAGRGLENALFRFVYQPLRNPRGEVDGIAVIAVDVTAIVSARREAEAASRAKDEFLAMLGHELRNPLAPILTALQLMRLRGVRGADRERTIIERQVKHVVSLVDDLLDVSRITRGKIQLAQRPVALADVVAEAVEMASPLLEQQRHRLELDIRRDACTVNADPARLAQVVSNLLTNAAKYTEPGGRITVTGRVDGSEAVLSVADSGIGISPDMLPRVFDLFAQERQALDRAAGGLGLGLAIVKSLVSLHGGTVSAESEGHGKGSVFTVRLPLAETPHPTPLEAPRPHPALDEQLRVLVVDDNHDAATLLSDALSLWGHDTRIARDGVEALQVGEEFLPDVALLDIGLPVMDGYELARRFAASPALRHTRLIAVTGYGQEQDRWRSQDAGFAAHLTKPVDLESVRRLVATAPRAEIE